MTALAQDRLAPGRQVPREWREEDVLRPNAGSLLMICLLATVTSLVPGMGRPAASLSAQGHDWSYAASSPSTPWLRANSREGLLRRRSSQPPRREAQSGYPGALDQVAFERISVEHGLSQSSVNAVLQDSRGFMWFGTDDGLNRYDGYDFVVYQSDPHSDRALSHDTVTSLVDDGSGGLWIGTRGGLDRFDLDTARFSHYRHDEEDPHSLVDDEILVLHQDSAHRLWVGTSGGLDRFDSDAEQFVHHPADAGDPHSLPDNQVMSIYEDGSGVLWIGTWRGLSRWNPDENTFTHYRLAPEDATELGHNAVQSIVEDSRGTLWVATGGSGFYRFDRQTEQFSQLLVDPLDVGGLAQNDVRSIWEDQTGTLWLGTDGGGLYQFDRDEAQLIPYQKDPQDSGSVSSNYVNTIYESRRGVLWIGTSGGGVSKLDRDKRKFALYQADPSQPSSLSHNRVLALAEDVDGTLWVGTDGGGLDRLDAASGTFSHYTHNPDDPYTLSNNRVTAIHPGRDGDLWIGTWGGGIARFDRQTGRFAHYQADPFDPHSLSSNMVHSIYEDYEGILWVGTDSGLERFDPAEGRFSSYASSGEEVRAIHGRQGQDLWFATDDGLARFDRKAGRVVRYRADSGSSGDMGQDEVNAIYQDHAGTLWVGTSRGLSQFDPGAEVFTHYGEEDGLADDAIQAILEDDQGYLWISTTGGLSRFDPASGVFRNYDVSDGLHGYEFTRARCRTSDGTMYFGGINGLNAFVPDRVKDNPYPPPVVLTSLTQGGRDVAVGRAVENVTQVRLTWPNNSFEFGFVALNYHQSEKNQYAYKLEGFDGDWNAVGTRRFGRYTNLPGGTYNLRMKASNNDGVWNDEGISLKVTVVPPFWATWPFRGGILLLLLVGAAAGYQLRVRGVEARSRELEKLAANRTVALSRANERLRQEIAERKRAEEALAQQAAEAAVAAERSRLARDLHDAVTQLLFSASLIAEALPEIWENDQDEGRNLLAEMRRLSRGALAEMRTLLLELRPGALTETSLGDLLHQLAEAAAGRTDVSIVVREDGEFVLPNDVHVALYRIAQEALNNIIKHARASRATISVCSAPSGDPAGSQQRVTLSVGDDGCGFDPDCVLPDHLGLGIIRERAERIGAKLDIESELGRGTEVTVTWTGPHPQSTMTPFA
jgi:ligand-binding sensor domain-containing protein/signal transduction histidine kinase